MASNVFQRLPDLPKIFWRYLVCYISYATRGMQVIVSLQVEDLQARSSTK